MNDRDTDVGHSKDEKTLKKPKEKTSFWSLTAHNDTILQHFKSFYIRKHHNHGKQMLLEVLEEVSKKFKTHPPKQQLQSSVLQWNIFQREKERLRNKSKSEWMLQEGFSTFDFERLGRKKRPFKNLSRNLKDGFVLCT